MPCVQRANSLMVFHIYFCIGQQNDARVNLMLALSAIRNGAKCANYVEVVNLLFQEETKGMYHIYFHLYLGQVIQKWTKVHS